MQKAYAKWDHFEASDSDEESEEMNSDDDSEEEGPDDTCGLSVHASRRPCQLGPPPSEEAPAASPVPPAGLSAMQQLQRLQRAEHLGEEVLTLKQQLVNFDRRRNQNREGLAALRDLERRSASGGAAVPIKHWMCLGDVFIKRTSSSAREMLETDQRTLEEEMERCRTELKEKTSALCTLDPSISGGSDIHRSFVQLQGVSSSEMADLLSGVRG